MSFGVWFLRILIELFKLAQSFLLIFCTNRFVTAAHAASSVRYTRFSSI